MKPPIDDKYQAHCPKCNTPIVGFFLLKGTLYTEQWVVVKSFICPHCLNIIHWGERKQYP